MKNKKRKPSQEKRVLKSKEELIAELKNNKKFQEKLSFSRDKFFPMLVSASRNIQDAQQFLSSINTVIMQDFLERMKEIKMSDMNLKSKIDPADEKSEEIKALLSAFDEMNVFDAKDCIEGMRSEIQLFINEEMETRGLDTLKQNWIM